MGEDTMPKTQTPLFDRLLALHKSDPEAFEKERRRLLDEAIESAPEAYRGGLYNIQFRFEAALFSDRLKHSCLSELCRSNPREFEAERIRILRSGIESATPEQRERLCGIQFYVDADLARGRYKNPTARLNRMIELFWRGFFRFQGALKGQIPAEERPAHSADIVAFKPRKEG